MNQNHPPKITIEQVANGFIFEITTGVNCCSDPSKREVFQSLSGLNERLAQHFTHRNVRVPTDELPVVEPTDPIE
jgi:hypothetical protein